MATPFERSFIQHCTLEDSLRLIIEANLPPEVFADDMLRSIYEWVLHYWHTSSESRAPSPDAMKVHFESVLAEHEIEVDLDPTDSVEWSISSLAGTLIDRRWQEWSKDFVTDMSMADLGRKGDVLDFHLQSLMDLSTSLTRRSEGVDVREGMAWRLEAYHDRVLARQSTTTRGLHLGMPQVDTHLDLIHPGELCVLAGGPKTGKSFGIDWAALQHWEAGGEPVLYTLENSVETTLDRIACMALSIDSNNWARGTATEEELLRVDAFIERLKGAERGIHVLMPEEGKRTVEHMVRQAKSLGDALFIDQLTFIEVPEDLARKARHEQVRGILHKLKVLISTGVRIPCLLAHQINREGVKAAEKAGRLEMYYMAEASEVERTADFVLGIWQGSGLRAAGRAYLQLLAARRVDLVSWELAWKPWIGTVFVRGVIDLSGDD